MTPIIFQAIYSYRWNWVATIVVTDYNCSIRVCDCSIRVYRSYTLRQWLSQIHLQRGSCNPWKLHVSMPLHRKAFQYPCYSKRLPKLGFANQKNKIICRVLLCVGVCLIKKTPSWQQISCIPCSGNLENSLSKSMYLSQMVNKLQCSPYSAHRYLA